VRHHKLKAACAGVFRRDFADRFPIMLTAFLIDFVVFDDIQTGALPLDYSGAVFVMGANIAGRGGKDLGILIQGYSGCVRLDGLRFAGDFRFVFSSIF
jgi:hypothetical protein